MSAKHVLVCWECGRPVELRGNETYCEHCGPGVEAVQKLLREANER